MLFQTALRDLIAAHIEEEGTQGVKDALNEERARIEYNELTLLSSGDHWNAMRSAYVRICPADETNN